MDTLDSVTSKVNKALENSKLFYLANDPERALGLEKLITNLVIVHIDNNEYLDDFDLLNIKYYCLAKESTFSTDFFRSSIKLIKSPEFQKFFDKEKALKNYFQTFKISKAFEIAVQSLNANLINTPASLNRRYEDKISQFQILSKLPIQLPKSKIAILCDLTYQNLSTEFGEEFIIQFAWGHTGSSTVFIKNEEDFSKVLQDFSKRTVKVSEFVDGVAYTVNCCITRQGIAFGGLSKQITGIEQLTPLTGGTVGNDWSQYSEFINGLENLKNEIMIIGERMKQDGYFGLFGLDLIVKEDGSHVFIEINARQPASIPMYTKIQLSLGQIPLSLLHLAEFLNIEYKIDIKEYNNANMLPSNFSQIFIRAPKDSEIKTRLTSGIYRLQGDNAGFNPVTDQQTPNTIFLDEQRDKSLIFQKPAYSIDQVDGVTGILLLTQSPGRIIKGNDEFARIQIATSAFQSNVQLKQWIVEALQAVYNYQI